MNSARTRDRLGKLGLLVGSLFFLFVVDRSLLTPFPLPRWEPDPVLHYRNRPGTYGWGRNYDRKPIHINRHGFHDDDFPEHKADGEFRALILGDSVVMGHGVTAAETFSNQLERVLPSRLPGYRAYQVINAGVQGYATAQYLEVLKRSMRFRPDFIAVGLCVNDVTDYLRDPARGGSGMRFPGILPISQAWLGSLINETGFGRLALDIGSRARRRWSPAEARLQEDVRSVRKMVEGSGRDPMYDEAWERTLSDLARMYALARQEGVPIVLLIFPYAFQLGHPELQEPQRMLRRHAELEGVRALDVTEVVEGLLEDGVPLARLYLDHDHLTVEGHAVLADRLSQELTTRILASVAAAPRPEPGAVGSPVAEAVPRGVR